MDPDGSRRYEQQTSYPSTRGFVPTSSRGGSSSGASERFRQTHVQMPPTPASAVGPSAGSRSQGSGSYGYTQGQQQYAPPMQENTIQYRPDYPQDAQRQQQQFGSYSSNLIYNMPSSIQQQPADYEVQQFQPRQSAAIEVLSNQFNVPQYYNPTEATSGAGSSQQSYPSASFQHQGQYQQGTQNRSSNSSPYTAGISDYSQMNMANVLDQPESSSQQGRRSSGDDAYTGYLESLKQTFRETQHGRLVDAGRRLLRLSEWIASQANDLGT